MLNRFLRLSRRERTLLIKAFVSLPIAMMWVRFTPRLPLEPQMSGNQCPQNQAVIADTVRMVKAAARYIHGASCLPQSLVVQRLLRAQGIPTTIRIGVRKSSGLLDAHAWVEHDGLPITDPPAVHHEFRVLAADPRS